MGAVGARSRASGPTFEEVAGRHKATGRPAAIDKLLLLARSNSGGGLGAVRLLLLSRPLGPC